MEEKEKLQLEELLEELESYRGRHTELITVFIPSGATPTKEEKKIEEKKESTFSI